MNLPFEVDKLKDEATSISLAVPCERYIESYLEACKETWGNVHHNYILHDPSEFDSWKTTIFESYEKSFAGIDLPDGYFPSLTLWAVLDDRYIGTVNIRTEQDEKLFEYGGTYGYFIRLSDRRRGYGTAIALLGLEATRMLGVEPIATTVMESNVASVRLSEKLPYSRKERYIADADGVVQPVWRYWFD